MNRALLVLLVIAGINFDTLILKQELIGDNK